LIVELVDTVSSSTSDMVRTQRIMKAVTCCYGQK